MTYLDDRLAFWLERCQKYELENEAMRKTYQEEASKLILRYSAMITRQNGYSEYYYISEGKKLALMVIDDILNVIKQHEGTNYHDIKYWKAVKGLLEQ